MSRSPGLEDLSDLEREVAWEVRLLDESDLCLRDTAAKRRFGPSDQLGLI